MFESDLRNLQDDSPLPLKLNTMPEVQLDFIHSQKMTNLKNEHMPINNQIRRKNASTLSINATQAKGNNGPHRVYQLQESMKEEEIKLPIVEHAGPPGNPMMSENVYGQQYQNGGQTQRFDS